MLGRAMAGHEHGDFRRTGTGRKNDPFRYWLPGKEDDLQPGPDATPEELERWSRRWSEKTLAKIRKKAKAFEERTALFRGRFLQMTLQRPKDSQIAPIELGVFSFSHTKLRFEA